MSELSRAGRVAAAGLAASAFLALVLGFLIPAKVQQDILDARLTSIHTLVRTLEIQGLTPPTQQALSGQALRSFDETVQGGLLGGDNVRVKLWNRDGIIVYSDEPRYIGQRFEMEDALVEALRGNPAAEISDLSSPENYLDRTLGSPILEYYVPLHDVDGTISGVFEVYQDFEPLHRNLVAIRSAVWIAVGSGLGVLLLFLVSLFAATTRAIDRERAAAVARGDDLALLLRASDSLSATPSLEEASEGLLRLLVDGLALRWAALETPDHPPRFVPEPIGDERAHFADLSRAALERGEQVQNESGPVLVNDDRPDGLASALAMPFAVGDGVGVLALSRASSHPFERREEAIVRAVAAELGVAVERDRLFGALAKMTDARGALLRRLVDAQELERKHLVGDLHDGAGQTLTRVLYGIRGSRARLSPPTGPVARELARLEALVDGLIVELRQYMTTIRPAMIEDLGLSETIESFARGQEEESGLEIHLRAGQLPRVEPVVAITLYRAVQEAVINARKHADARVIEVSLDVEGHVVVMEVRDDGVGSASLEEGMGLSYLRDRVASLGGNVLITSAAGSGTSVRVEVPFAE